MEIFIFQKRTNGISNAHFENIKSFSSLLSVMKYCIKDLKLTPLMIDAEELHLVPLKAYYKDQFVKDNNIYFGRIRREGINNEIVKIEEAYRIQKMEVQE